MPKKIISLPAFNNFSSLISSSKISYISKAEFLKRNSKFDLTTYKFLIEIDKNDPTHLTIIKDPKIKLSKKSIKEAIKRVNYLYKLEKHLNTFYKPPYDLKNVAFDNNLAQYPYSIFTNPLPNLWGFVKEPQKPLFLSGQNFIEPCPLGLMSNPQGLYEEYSFGATLGNNLDEIRVPILEKMNNRQKSKLKFLEDIITKACQKNNKKPEDLKILDIGCNTGSDLQLLNKSNKYKHFYGIDIDTKALNIFNELIKKDDLTNIKIAKMNFLDPKIPEKLEAKFGIKKFDVLIFCATLEHLTNPELAFKYFSELLTPGGVLILTAVPDIESVRARFNECYGDVQKPTHLYFFSKKTLQNLGNKYGLELHPLPELLPAFSKLDFLYEEVFPSFKNRQWHFFGKPLPSNIKFEDLYLKNTPPNLDIFHFDPDFKTFSCIVNFRYFKNYEKNKDNFELIFKEFLINSLKNPKKALQYIKEIKESLFNLFILDKPKDFNYKTITELANNSLAVLIRKYSIEIGNYSTIDGYMVKK
ncbi:MAG: class I SAM-dependent methyltransferase [Candidatus Margulisiibacteriota bacterium]|jgi:SAM-dependent methyltransferase